MSAGKSTLVNALIGQNVAKMAQGVCTSRVEVYSDIIENNGTISTFLEDELIPGRVKEDVSLT